MSEADKPPQREFSQGSARAEVRSPDRGHLPSAGAQILAGCRVVVLDRAADVAPYIGAWTALCAQAAEANVFYEPWFLLPALLAFASRQQRAGDRTVDISLVLVIGEPEGPPSRTPRNEVWGVFPLERRAPSDGPVPLSHFRLFQHDYSYLPIPLVHRDHGPAVMQAFFDWISSQKRCRPLLAIDDLPVGGAFHQLLIDELGRRGAHVHVRDRWNRALLAPTCDAETYETRAVAGKHRKELRRQRRRLGEIGQLTTDVLGPQDDVEPWLTEFLGLEASGWKGREGTALGSRIPDAIFFRDMARGCHQAGRLTATAIRIDGKAVVMQILLRSGEGAFAFKIGYDESYARFSPGVLLELDLIERVANEKFAAWVDSAATRDHPMINRIWTERRNIERWMVGLDGGTSLLLSLVPVVQWWKNWRRGRLGESPT